MRKLFTAVVAAAAVLTVSSAFAAPVELNGDIKAHYRWNTEDDAANKKGGKFIFRLNAKTAIGDNADIYARFAAEKLTGDKIGSDFDKDKYGNDVAVVDQFGFIFRDKSFEYKLGRQGVSITPTALLYSSEGYIGKHMGFMDGLVATGKSGVTSLQAVIGRADLDAVDKDKVYSLHASVNPVKNWTFGGTVAKYNPHDDANRTFWGVDAAYTAGKAAFVADYLKSDADAKNNAFVVGVDYSIDDKNTFSVYAHRTGANSHIATDWDSGEKGVYYIYDHKFDTTTSLNIFYKDNTDIATKKDNTSFRTTVTYKF